MDGAREGWYFSTMPASAESFPKIAFHRTKYGPELLLDAAWLSDMPNFIASPEPHSLAFHDILLVTEGRGRFRLDGVTHEVAPGRVLFTRPGELRRWEVEKLDGACLFFDEAFLAETFSDARFLAGFAFFRPGRPQASLDLPPADQGHFLARFKDMAAELRGLRPDAPHRLRALLYDLLVILGRAYEARYGPPTGGDHPLVEAFEALIEKHFTHRHRLEDYAADLAVTKGHLSALCGAARGMPAGAMIRARLVLEAKRRLIHSKAPAASIAFALGFTDAAYFSRFMRRETGLAPSDFRLS